MDSFQLATRFLNLSVSILNLTDYLQQSQKARIVANQIVRSTTSVGANYEEAIGAVSRADFIYKQQIVLKELRETQYWLKLIHGANLLEDNNSELQRITKENLELVKIITKTVVTAKLNLKK